MKAERSNNPAILFDLDGTLIDSVYEHVIAWLLRCEARESLHQVGKSIVASA
jgi:hypothetical protein